jgi:hypothetical protein
MTKQEAINTINASFPSIWTKDDVLQLINKIDVNESKENKLEGFVDKDKITKKIREAVDNAISGMSTDEIVDVSSCEFEIRNGNEIQLDSIDINFSDIIDTVIADVEEAIDQYIEEMQELEDCK